MLGRRRDGLADVSHLTFLSLTPARRIASVKSWASRRMAFVINAETVGLAVTFSFFSLCSSGVRSVEENAVIKLSERSTALDQTK
jgi:hypothetical protein